MATWSPPTVEVISVEALDGQTMITLRVPSGLHPPLAPSSLVDSDQRVIDLDAVLGEDGGGTVFRTREVAPDGLVGRVIGLQQWWLPEAFEAVTDTSRPWTRRAAPPADRHEHCLLDSQTIEQGVGDATGWQCGADWVCPDCYQRYFLDDELGVRGSGPGVT